MHASTSLVSSRHTNTKTEHLLKVGLRSYFSDTVREIQDAYKILFEKKKHEDKTPLASRRRENKGNIKMDLKGKDCKYVIGIHHAQERGQGRVL